MQSGLAGAIQAHLITVDSANSAVSKGRAFERLIKSVLEAIPGVSVPILDAVDVFKATEIDLLAWNAGDPAGLAGLPNPILVECKCWTEKVGSLHVGWFDTKLHIHGCSFGILIAARGITGNPHDRSAANFIAALAVGEARSLIVLTRMEIEGLQNQDDVTRRIIAKYVKLKALLTPF